MSAGRRRPRPKRRLADPRRRAGRDSPWRGARRPRDLRRLPSCDTGMPCHMRENSTVAAVRPLRNIFAVEADRAYGHAEARGERQVITGCLSDPGVQAAEGKENG